LSIEPVYTSVLNELLCEKSHPLFKIPCSQNLAIDVSLWICTFLSTETLFCGCFSHFILNSSVIIINMNPMRALLFLVLLSVAQPAVAQVGTNAASYLGVQTNLAIEPFFPAPGETVTVSLENLRQEFNSSITWLLDGVEIADAKNQREVELTAGALGTESEITTVITRDSGRIETYSTTLTPIYVDIVIEP
jgi:hypothetical protein